MALQRWLPEAPWYESLPFLHAPVPCSQVEAPEAVAEILAQLRALPARDAYRHPEEYDLAYPGYEGDAGYYADKARTGRVFYLGVGTGRIFLQLLEVNPNVIGVDSSPEMLRFLAQNHPKVRADQLLLADAARAHLPSDHFDTIIAPYSFLQVVDEEALPRLLENVCRWLKPGGRFHTDIFSPYLIPFRKPGLEVSVRKVRQDTRVAIYIKYDHVRQTMTEMAVIDSPGGRQLLEMHLSYYLPKQLIGLFRDAGLAEPTIAGGYHGEPFDPATNEILVLETTKPAAPAPALSFTAP